MEPEALGKYDWMMATLAGVAAAISSGAGQQEIMALPYRFPSPRRSGWF
jgi:hypothetical protein